MADRLRDYGLQSERLLWPTKGPSRFEEELGVDELEQALGLTTLEKTVMAATSAAATSRICPRVAPNHVSRRRVAS